MVLVTGAFLWAHVVREEVKKVRESGREDYFKHLTHIALNITMRMPHLISLVF
jgi:hypothetical protein